MDTTTIMNLVFEQSLFLVKYIAIPFTAFFLFQISIKRINKILDKFCKRREVNYHTCLMIKKATFYTLSLLTFIFVLQNMGIDVSTLIAALGISGVALSFGMKDTVSNIIAGILIILYKQFEINDYIKIKDWEGKIIDINIRHTTLQHNNMTILIPNSILYSTTVAIVEKEEPSNS